MKTSIIEVGLPTDKVSEVQPMFEQCLLETGDMLIGLQTYDDQTLLVVRLFGDHLQNHLDVLAPTFKTGKVDSFQIVSCYLFKIVFKQEAFEATLRNFPLQAGESWFRSANGAKEAYLCLNAPNLSEKQVSWLAAETSIVQLTNES